MPARRIRFAAALLLVSAPAFSQGILNNKYQVAKTTSLVSFLDSLEQDDNAHFFYLDDWLKPIVVEKTNRRPLVEILRDATSGTDINYVSLGTYAVIFFKDPAGDIQRQHTIARAEGRNRSVEKLTFGSWDNYRVGKKLVFKAKVVDENTLAPVPGVTVYFHELNANLTTDANGEYELVLPGGEYLITHSAMNYQEKIVHLQLYDDAETDIILQDEPSQLQEVVISDQSIINRRIGQSVLNMAELRKAPSFLGEADIIKQIQLKSGVTTTSEASAGFHVRGGGVDQNLVLYDGTPIFNTAHALGFFNAFNADVIRAATFYKGGIPAEYGGRTSSVLNIISREGDYRKWHGKAGVGLVSSDIVLGGPLKKDTSSLMLSARSSYSDWMLDLLKTRFKGISQGSIQFYDASIKYTYKIDASNKISFSSYTSRDRFSLASDTLNQWQNLTASVLYERTISQQLFATATLAIGGYSYNVHDSDPATAFDLDYGMTYPSLKIDLNRNSSLHNQSFGFQTTYYSFHPGDLESRSAESSARTTHMPVERAIESALYFSDNFHYTDRIQIEAGVRLSTYNRLGPGEVYRYRAGEPLEPQNTIDSTWYGAGDVMKTFVRPEPRLSVNYILDLQSSIKLGFNRIYQYVHLITNSATVTPVDIWQLSNTYFTPQRADQVSVGYFRNSRNNKFEMVAEAYYKYQKNILEFKDGANLILNPQLETDLLRGSGRSYGAEFSLNKLTGRLQGGLSYSYSRSLRRVAGIEDVETLNDGKWFPSNADQPNVVNLNWNFSVTRRVFFTGNFLYHTGRPVSLPSGGYIVNGIVIPDFQERNNYRIPDYHRLDIAFVIEGSNRKNRSFESSWVFSLYNVYGRKNPYSVFFAHLGGGVVKPYQLSLIGTAVPSISYSVRF